MTIGLRGSGAGFASVARKFGRLADDGEDAMADAATEAADAQLARQYRTETGPSGAKWAPKKRPNGKPTLEASGDMKAGTKAERGPGPTVLLSVPDPAQYHQSGTSRMVARPILPNGSLEGEWQEAIDEAAHKAIHETFEGG